MDRRVDLLKILSDEGKLTKVLLYPGMETETDPFEHTKANTFLNPITIKAYVTQLSFESLKWKYTGLIPVGSIQMICDVKYEGIVKLADKIKIDENYYKTWKDDSENFMVMKRDNYLVVILGLKNI
jgi:hypothetical protein